MDIRCRKTNCKYNKKYTCQAKDLLIKKDCKCAVFVDTPKNSPDTSRSMFEVAPEYAPQRSSLTMCIDCKAPCMFKNEHSQCVANGITVNALNETPYCITFLKKC